MAQVAFRFIEDGFTITAVDLPKAIALELIFTDKMRIAMAKYSMENLLGLDIVKQINAPDLMCYLFIALVAGLELRQGNHLLECVVQMFLVIMEGRVGIFLYSLGPLLMCIKLTSSWIFKLAGVNDSWHLSLKIAWRWLLFFLEEVEKLRDIINGIFPIEV